MRRSARCQIVILSLLLAGVLAGPSALPDWFYKPWESYSQRYLGYTTERHGNLDVMLPKTLGGKSFRLHHPTPGSRKSSSSWNWRLTLQNYHGDEKSWWKTTRAWWTGSHVCTEKKKVDQDFELSQKEEESTRIVCKDTGRSSSCFIKKVQEGKTEIFEVKYQCCYGYARKGRKCVKVHLKDLPQTLRSVGATKFLRMAHEAGLLDSLYLPNLTVFAPMDDAFHFTQKSTLPNQVDSGWIVDHDGLAYLLDSHVSSGQWFTEELGDDYLLPPIGRNPPLRINVYHNSQSRVLTANCANIVVQNRLASNGVLHVVDRILPQPKTDVADLLSSMRDLSIFVGLLHKLGLLHILHDPRGNFTVLAPLNEAFGSAARLRRSHHDLLRAHETRSTCIAKLLRHHVIPRVVCSAAFTPQETSYATTSLGSPLPLSVGPLGQLMAGRGSRLLESDLLATNGVVHLIDSLLIPVQAKTFTETLLDAGMSKFLDLLATANLTRQYLDSLDNATFFVPSLDYLEVLGTWDPAGLLFHVSPADTADSELHNNQLLQTLLPGKKIRLNLNGQENAGEMPLLTAQCVPVVSPNNGICGGVIHVIDKMLPLPAHNLLAVAEALGDGFSLFRQLAQETGLAELLQHDPGPLTLLLPSNTALVGYGLPLGSPAHATQLIKSHLLPGIVCCAAVRTGGLAPWTHLQTLGGWTLLGTAGPRGEIKFGSAPVHSCDHVANNGVVHVIDQPLKPFSSWFSMQRSSAFS